jgi:hypothetical protein
MGDRTEWQAQFFHLCYSLPHKRAERGAYVAAILAAASADCLASGLLSLRSYFSRVLTGFQSRVIAAEIALLINAFRSQYCPNIMLPKRRIITRGFHR